MSYSRKESETSILRKYEDLAVRVWRNLGYKKQIKWEI